MTEHRLIVTEPAWVEGEYRPSNNGEPVKVGGPEVLHSDGLDEIFNEATYECSCGRDFDDWQEATDHFDEVTNG